MSAGADYYSVDAILAEETVVPARLVHGCTGAPAAAAVPALRARCAARL